MASATGAGAGGAVWTRELESRDENVKVEKSSVGKCLRHRLKSP